MRLIKNAIEQLSIEEREIHQKIIEECLRGEEELIEIAKETEQSIVELDEAEKKFKESIIRLDTSANETLDKISDASLEVNNLSFNIWANKKRNP